MSLFGSFDDWGRRQEGFVQSARKSAPGLPDEQVVPGAMVTLSPNLATGDRSYTRDVYEIVASNAGHVVIRPTGKMDKPWTDKPSAISLHEHEFYPAEHILAALDERPLTEGE